MIALLNRLLRPHPDEVAQGVWFQEEARAMRVSLLMFVGYSLFWLSITVLIADAHPLSVNIANIGTTTFLLVVIVALLLYLMRRPYRRWFKYGLLLLAIAGVTLIQFLYHIDMGYSATLKAPTFMTYFAFLAVAALFFSIRYQITVGTTIIVMYAGLLASMILLEPVQFGTPLELFTTPRINFVYQLLRLGYILAFMLVAVVLVVNVRRLVRLRVAEAEQALAERVAREKTQSLLERYFTPEIAQYLAEHPQEIGGVSQRVTVLFCDLRGFTALSERIGPAESVRLLNMVFERLVNIVFKHRGTLDKFIGDGMLVSFGTPTPAPDDALRAAQAALEMVEAVRGLGGEYALMLGTAIHTGDAIFGNIGSPRRMELTVIGDVVNTTSRIEALNKEFGTSVLVSEETYREIADKVRAREMPSQALRGKVEAVRLYAVDGLVAA